jgi:hypothetical protein
MTRRREAIAIVMAATFMTVCLFCVVTVATAPSVEALNPPSRRVLLRQDPNMIEPPLVSSLSQPNNIVFPGNPVPSDPSNLRAAASISTCGCQVCPCASVSVSTSSATTVLSNTPKGIGSTSSSPPCGCNVCPCAAAPVAVKVVPRQSCGCNVCPCAAAPGPVAVKVVPRQSLKPACPCAAASGVTVLKAKASSCPCASATATATTVLTNKNTTTTNATAKVTAAHKTSKPAAVAKKTEKTASKPAVAALSPQQKKVADLKQSVVAIATQIATESDATKKAALKTQHAAAVKAYLEMVASTA